jgi:MFS family permease
MKLALRLFVPFAAGYFLSFLLRNVNAIIAPDLRRELGVSAADLGVLTAAYFVTFASFQLPLGVLLDRYGARRVEASLLMVAALGAAWFAVADDLPTLTSARALIGLGVCACLMAAFKAFATWYPSDRLASLNAAVMVSGGLGALAATTPLVAVLEILGRRDLFMALAAMSAITAVAVLSTPEKRIEASGASLRDQIRAVGEILKSRLFWSYAPMAAAGLGTFVALQGLWAVPWLMDVAGEARETAASRMFAMTVAMVCGSLATAALVGPLARAGFPPGRFMALGYVACLGATAVVWSGAAAGSWPWIVLGSVFAVGNVAFAEITRRFPPALAGRVSTTLNFCIFMGAFALQAGYGFVLDGVTAAGFTVAEAHHAALGTLLVLQVAGLVWFALNRRTVRGSDDPSRAKLT